MPIDDDKIEDILKELIQAIQVVALNCMSSTPQQSDAWRQVEAAYDTMEYLHKIHFAPTDPAPGEGENMIERREDSETGAGSVF